MLKRITYVSRFAQPLTAADIDQLGAVAAAKNRRLGVTGVLMASGGLFYQIIEGEPARVESLYRTILEDDRHSDVLLLRSEEVADRLFPNWSMQTVNLDADSHVRLLPLKALMKATVDQQRTLDSMVRSIERVLEQEMLSG